MKTLTLIVLAGVFGYGLCLPFFGINVQITGADYSLSPKIAANFVNASTLASALITPSTPIPVKYLYFQNSMFWSLNDYAYQYVYGARNITVAMNYVFNNLTAAAADNTNYPGVFTTLLAAIQNAITVLGTQTSYVQNFAMANITSVQTDLSTELTNLLALMTSIQSGISDFKLSGLTLSSANVLRYIPPTANVTLSLNKLFALSILFAGNISFATTYMNNSYTAVKLSDTTFTSIETQVNATVNATNAMVTASELYINQTIMQFLTSANATYNNFKKSLPAALTSNSQFAADIQSYDSLIYGNIGMGAGMLKDSIYQQLEYYKTSSNQTLNQWYQSNMGTFNSMRSSLFYQLMTNKSYLACGQTFTSTGEARFKAMGGPASAVVCNQADTAFFKKINASVQAALNIANIDINSTLVLFNRCLKVANITAVTNNPNYYAGYSMIQCFENLASTYLTSAQSTYSLIGSSVYSIITQWGLYSSSRMMSCNADYMNYVNSLLNPLYVNFTTCVSP